MSIKFTPGGIPVRDIGYPKECDFCFPTLEFYDSSEFARHLRVVHSTKEGGSYVCRYGENGVCQKLPLEGVSDVDYEAHIRRFHTCVEAAPPRPSTPEAEPKFTLSSFTQNLSAVLADPSRKRTDVATFFTRHWGDSFVPPSSIAQSHLIPPVKAPQFEAYVKSTGKTYKKYKAAKKALTRQQLAGEDKSDADDLPTVFVDPSFLLSHGPTFSAIFTEPAAGDIDPLSQTSSGKLIPGVSATVTDVNAKAGGFRDYHKLHSRLESMHDVVDSRLASKLVWKSGDFWRIVHSYGGLHEDLASAMNDIRHVRGNLKEVVTSVCDRSKKIIYLYEMRERKQKLLAKLRDIACLRDAQATVQMMLNQSDYPKAIDCIETSQEVLESELSGVNCFRHLGSQLNELYEIIGRMMHEDFAQVIQKEFGTKPEEGTLISHEGEIASVVMGLIQVRKYSFVMVIRTEIGEALKAILRQVVKQQILLSGLDLSQFDPTLLGDPVRKLDFSQWMETVDEVLEELFTFCCRLQALQDICCEMADCVSHSRQGDTREISPPSQVASNRLHTIDSTSSDQDDPFSKGSSPLQSQSSTPSADPSALIAVEIRSDFHLKRAIGLIAEYGYHCAQQRLTRLLAARYKEGDNLTASPQELRQVVDKLGAYLRRCAEQGWHRTQVIASSPLSSCIHKMTVDYIDRFHAARRVKVSDVLDSEYWRQAEVPAAIQQTVDEFVNTGLLRSVESKKDLNDSNNEPDYVSVDGEQFVVVGSALVFLEVLADYCECAASLTGFTADILSRMVELLKLFNSRCCQLILGAGALQLVGLKTISVRNLAIASRSLQFVAHFVPIIAKDVENQLRDDQKHLCRHFKQVLSDYADHVNEISAKLASVIDHHTINCLSQWQLKGGIPSLAFQTLCKQLQKFHNGLSGIMPNEQIKKLFETVHSNFKTALKLQLAKIGVSPHDSLTYGFVNQDYTFYTTSILSMESCSDMQLETLNEVIYGS